jgi:methylmalonyl-CoA epimerase
VAFAHRAHAVVDGLRDVFGVEASHIEEGPGFVERMFRVGEACVQTLEATGPGIVERFVERRGSALHHVAFEVDDIDAALDDLRRRSVALVDTEPRLGGEGARIAFLHPSALGGLLAELVEPIRGRRIDLEGPDWEVSKW